jgi:hypothetical protein
MFAAQNISTQLFRIQKMDRAASSSQHILYAVTKAPFTCETSV